MEQYIRSKCTEITKDLLPKFKGTRDILNSSNRQSLKVDEALRTLMLHANEEQKVLLHGVCESFENAKCAKTTFNEMTKMGKELLSAKIEINRCVDVLLNTLKIIQEVLPGSTLLIDEEEDKEETIPKPYDDSSIISTF
jgi:hypothetical protein